MMPHPDERSSVAVIVLLAVIIARTDSFKCLSPCLCTGVNITCSEKDLYRIPEFETINGANIVDLSSNDIEEIERGDFDWKGTEQLQFLYLNVNSIVHIHEQAFSVLRNLEYLDLSNNNLEYIPSRMFESNDRLTTIRLAGNMFGPHVPQIICETLEVLDLSFSKLSSFTSDHVKYLPSLKQLNLQANNIVYLNPNIFANHQGISVDLSYNFWACNCSTVEIFNWALENDEKIKIDDPIKCMNRNNIYMDMFNKSAPYEHKESCNIDEDTFGVPHIKELSLVKESTVKHLEHVFSPSTSDESEESKNDYHTIKIISITIIVLILILAVAIGVLLGFGISKYMLKQRRRQRRRSSLLDPPPE